MNDIIAEIKARVPSILQIASDAGISVQKKGIRYFILCPWHDDNNPSCELFPDENKGYCFACKKSFDVIDLWAFTHNCSLDEAIKRLATQFELDKSEYQRIKKTYDYKDEFGKLAYQVIRKHSKGFIQRRPDNKGSWIYNLKGIDPIPYRLPELLKSIERKNTIYIPEGEKDCNNIVRIGLTATCNSGGAGHWTSSHSKYFPVGCEVVILPDNDEPGKKHSEQVAEQLKERGCKVKIITLPGLPPKGDISDWLAAGHTKDELLHLVADTPYFNDFKPIKDNEVIEGWSNVIPLSVYNIPVFPVECLPGWLQQYVIELSEATQTPIDMSCMLVLSVIAAAIARKVVIVPHEGWQEPCNIYTVIALPPASRKSAVFAECTLPIVEYEKEIRKSMSAEVRTAQNEYKALEQALQQAQNMKAKALASGKELEHDVINELSNKIENYEIPSLTRLVADDSTIESIAALLAEQQGRIAILSAEGDLFDILAGRYNSVNSVNIGVVLKAHSGDFIRVDRIGRGPISVDSPALTIGLAIQPDVLRGLVQRPGFRGRGLLGRFLYSLPTSNIGYRRINTRPLSDITQQRYCSKVKSLLDLPLDKSSNALFLDDAAKSQFIQFENWLEPQLGEGGWLSGISDWAGKLAGAVMRITAILYMAEKAGNIEPWKQRITVDTVRKAIKIGNYLIQHAKAAFDVMGDNEDLEAAKGILQYVENKGINATTKRDLFRALQGRFKKANDMIPALAILQERGYLKETQLAHETGVAGRSPSVKYEFNPSIWNKNTNDTFDNIDEMYSTCNSVNCVNTVNDIPELTLLGDGNTLLAGEF